MANNDKTDAKPVAPKRSSESKTYDRVTAYIAAFPGGTFAAEPDDRLHTYVSDADWIAVVNYEQAEAGKESLSDTDALATRPKLFNRKRVSAE